MPAFKRDYKDNHGQPVWYFAYWCKRKRIRQSGFSTKRQAELAEVKSKERFLINGEPLAKNGHQTLIDVYDKLLKIKAQDREPATIRSIRSRRTAIQNYFGNRRVEQITMEDIENYKMHRQQQGIKNRSINHDLSALRQTFKYAYKMRLITINPMWEVESLKVKRIDPLLPTQAQLIRLLEEALKTRYGFQLYIWIYLLAFTGLRPAEALHLEWMDIDFGSNKLYVRRKAEHVLKMNQSRVFEIHPILRLVLLDWKKKWDEKFGEDKPHQWVFFHPQNPSQPVKGFRTAFATARRRIKLPWIHPYTFRHLFCTEVLKSGVERAVLKDWLGHSSLQMIDRTYSHVPSDYFNQQMKKVNVLGFTVPNPAHSCNANGPVVAPQENQLLTPSNSDDVTP